MKKTTSRFIQDYRLEIIAFVVGLVILAFELTAARIVAPYLGSTTYTWTSIIGVILAALAIGYAYGGARADKRENPDDIVVLLLISSALIVIINIVKEQFLSVISSTVAPLQLQAFFASLVLFAAPAVCLGAIMPYLAKLNIKDLASSGRGLANIDASGTVGSLVGTFLTGYILFGYVGTDNLLTLFALLLIVVSFLIKTRRFIVLRIILFVLFFSIGLLAPSPSLSGFIKTIDTTYNRVVIRDITYTGQPVRVLQTDGQGLQSGIYINNPNQLAFSYTKALSYAASLKDQPKNHLIIGGGAFTLPEYLAKKYPKTNIDTVEIDGEFTDISKQYFDYEQPDNLNIIQADGRHYINRTTKKYDFITLDAFNSTVPPFQLLTVQALQQLNRTLQPGGIVLANFISSASGPDNRMIQAAQSTFNSQFKYVYVYQINPNFDKSSRQNLLLIASNTSIDDKTFAKAVFQYPDFKIILDNELDFPNNTTPQFRDELAPVERYSL